MLSAQNEFAASVDPELHAELRCPGAAMKLAFTGVSLALVALTAAWYGPLTATALALCWLLSYCHGHWRGKRAGYARGIARGVEAGRRAIRALYRRRWARQNALDTSRAEAIRKNIETLNRLDRKTAQARSSSDQFRAWIANRFKVWTIGNGPAEMDYFSHALGFRGPPPASLVAHL